MTNSKSIGQKVVILEVFMVFGLALVSGFSIAGETTAEDIDDCTITAQVNVAIVKDPDAHYLKVDVTTTQGDVVLTGFVNSKETEERLVAKKKAYQGCKIREELLEDGREKASHIRQHFNCGDIRGLSTSSQIAILKVKKEAI